MTPSLTAYPELRLDLLCVLLVFLRGQCGELFDDLSQ